MSQTPRLSFVQLMTGIGLTELDARSLFFKKYRVSMFLLFLL